MKWRIGIGLCGVIMALSLSGCHKETSNKDKIIVTVEDTNIFLDEMMYYILQVEANGAGLQEIFSSISDNRFWEEEYVKDITYGDMLKNDTLEMAVMYEVFYNQALKKGYKLTKEEKFICENNTNEFLESMTEEQKVVTELTKAKIYKIQEKLALGSRYYQEVVDGLSVDKIKIRKGISYEDYKQYDIEYIYIPTVENLENGDIKPMSEEKKRQAHKRATTLLRQVKRGAAFGAIKNEQGFFETGGLSFVKGDKKCEKEVEKEVLKLKVGEIGNMVTVKSGYYILRLVHDSSMESYIQAMKKAVFKEERKVFLKAYADIRREYTITVNTQIWNEIVMGNTTIKEKMEEK